MTAMRAVTRQMTMKIDKPDSSNFTAEPITWSHVRMVRIWRQAVWVARKVVTVVAK
jgi:hypothetical protein